MSEQPEPKSTDSTKTARRRLAAIVGVPVLLLAGVVIGASLFGRPAGALVAAKQLNMGDKIDDPEGMFKREPCLSWLARDVLRCFNQIGKGTAPLQDYEHLKGRVLKRSLRPGEYVGSQDLFDGGEGIEMPLRQGYRAVGIRVDPETMVGILPQSRVDIHNTVSRNGKTYSEVIVRDVRVLAVDQLVVSDAAGQPSAVTVATVAMSPGDALTLELGKNVGAVHLSLRKLNGEESATLPPAQADECSYSPAVRPAVPDADHPFRFFAERYGDGEWFKIECRHESPGKSFRSSWHPHREWTSTKPAAHIPLVRGPCHALAKRDAAANSALEMFTRPVIRRSVA